MKKIAICLSVSLLLTACGNRGENYDASGSFESTEIMVSGEAQGKILSFDVQEGDKIQAGQLIGVIDTIQLYLAKMQLRKGVTAIRSNKPDADLQIAALEEQLTKQKTEQKRVENLLKANAATQKQYDDITAGIAILQKQLLATRTTIQNSASSIDAQSSALDIQVAQIEDRLKKCYITSPLTGTVLRKYAETGELAAPGRPLLKVADLDNVYLRAYFTSGQLENISLGQKVKVSANYGGDKVHSYDGTITWISPKSEFTPKNIQSDNERENLVYAVKISVANDGYIKIGMYGNVSIEQ